MSYLYERGGSVDSCFGKITLPLRWSRIMDREEHDDTRDDRSIMSHVKTTKDLEW